MNKPSNYILTALCLLVCMVITSCSNDWLLPDDDGPNGVNMDKMVEVNIPFKMGKGISTTVNMRAPGLAKAGERDANTDSYLSGIMVFVYENTGHPETDRRVAWYLFSNPAGGNLESSNGGWIADGDDPSCGKIKIFVPEGDCYIYLIGNATGSFFEFFENMEGSGTDELATLAQFWDHGTPHWTGNMTSTDGYLPIVGKVNNPRGDCRVLADGKIQYLDEEGKLQTLDPESGSESPDNSFVLKRLMSKVTVKVKGGEGVTFTPKDYRFLHVPTYVAPIEAAWTPEEKDAIPVVDTQYQTFGTQSRDSFTVYLPENVRDNTTGLTTFKQREEIVKQPSGLNQYETAQGHESHYQFKNAPKNSTYLELTGRFVGKAANGDPVSADCRYFIHLGDFGKDMNDFSLRRDYHYTYNITVKGVDDIDVEVEGGDDAPGAEGVVFKGGNRIQLDAHYEQVEMRMSRTDMDNGVYIYSDTPYGTLRTRYTPGTGGAQGTLTSGTREDVIKHTSWVKFLKQNSKGRLALYNSNAKNVLDAIDEFYSSGAQEAYYTCFVDEYYYDKDPLTGGSTTLSKFINADDRSFSFGSKITPSADGRSAVAEAVYVLSQHSISTFYDIDSGKFKAYGVETTDEVGTKPYGSPATQPTDKKTGRSNTIAELGTENNRRDVIDWTQNGWLLSADGTTSTRHSGFSGSAYQSCLARNRDFNGNGIIDNDELRWYTPALHQVMGLWIGEPVLPADAALFTGLTSSLKDANTCEYPVFTSTGSENRVVWSEQGCSYGDVNAAPNGGSVLAVRNIGATPSADSYTIVADPYYTYNSANRTITVHLSSAALRQYTSRELMPHNERSSVNRPPHVFQVASHPFVKSQTFTCTEGAHWAGSETHTVANCLQVTERAAAATGVTTIAAQYPGDGEAAISTAAWRLPNQREMALMLVAMDIGNGPFDYGTNVATYEVYTANCNGWLSHNWSESRNEVLHTRTMFSNSSYVYQGANGYMYCLNEKKMQLFYANKYGMGANGRAGYLCVRDVE